MKRFLILPAIIVLVNTINSQPAVDGFLRGKGNMDLALGGTFETYSQYYQKMNNSIPFDRYSIAASVYSAIGITNWLDLQVSAPYVATKEEFSDFQDFSSYLKLSAFNKSLADGKSIRLLFAGGVGFPMSDYETENQNSIGQQAKSVDGRMILQYAGKKDLFIMIQGGYSAKVEPVPSAIVTSVKVGFTRAKYYLDFWYDQQIALGGNDYFDYRMDIREMGNTDVTFRSLGVSYGKIGITFFKKYCETTGMAFGTSYVLWGRNTGQAISVSVSIVRRITFLN